MIPLPQEHAARRVAELEALCQARPTSTMLGDLAGCYFTIGETEKALPLAEAAWAKNRHHLIGMNLALILKDLGRHDEAFQAVQEAYWINSDDSYIKLGYGEALLKAGFWKQAWPIYDNARLTQQGAAHHLLLPRTVKEWNGETLADGDELLVINEGGTGDRLSYARWLPELSKRGIRWKFYPYDEVFSFFERIFPRENLTKDGEQNNPTHWCTTFSLPAKLDVCPNEVPPPLSFTALPEAVEKYKMSRVGLPIVGLCYDAKEDHQGGRKFRSLTEGQAMRLVCMTADKVQWVSLQHGKPMPFPVSNIPFQTWEDTAGLITNLDAVVTVDTAVMHLAGGLNKPMAVLLAGNSCWKFLRKGKKLPLYPSATFYRNPGRGFEDAITELISALRNGSAFN
jgi:tetratricopeptide (TPR) repeat protein